MNKLFIVLIAFLLTSSFAMKIRTSTEDVVNQCEKKCLEGSTSRVAFSITGWKICYFPAQIFYNSYWNLQVDSDGATENASLDAPSFATGYCIAKCENQ